MDVEPATGVGGCIGDGEGIVGPRQQASALVERVARQRDVEDGILGEGVVGCCLVWCRHLGAGSLGGAGSAIGALGDGGAAGCGRLVAARSGEHGGEGEQADGTTAHRATLPHRSMVPGPGRIIR